ncbi:MAG TPA: adenosylcobinamide-GDP ribazoletransferase [Steroidobacteraceae bacterium]|nr:adenosylcobinamide-GDP ribazoletransferase [Steroidobacteraceae bacterium]
MRLRGLRLATQFLTRLPVPAVEDFSAEEFSRSSAWFPFVGLAIGVVVSLILLVCSHRSAALAAAIGLLAWVWMTGALHLDGLADLSDALAAAHRDPQKFFAVLADPHLGAFGVVSIVLMLILKVTGLAELPSATSGTALIAFPLIPAWARLGPLAWSRWLKPLKPGHGERFAWHLHVGWIAFWVVALLMASVAVAPILCVAPVVIVVWGGWLRWRLGGTTGDCLGAGVEITEVVLLYALALVGTTSGTVASLL